MPNFFFQASCQPKNRHRNPQIDKLGTWKISGTHHRTTGILFFSRYLFRCRYPNIWKISGKHPGNTYLLLGLIQNIWIHIWCLTSCGVRSASARAFNTCAREVREQQQARARDARANRDARARGARARRARARAHKLSARANKFSKSQISSPNPLLESLFARARVGLARAQPRARLYLLARLARARVCACAPRARMC